MGRPPLRKNRRRVDTPDEELIRPPNAGDSPASVERVESDHERVSTRDTLRKRKRLVVEDDAASENSNDDDEDDDDVVVVSGAAANKRRKKSSPTNQANERASRGRMYKGPSPDGDSSYDDSDGAQVNDDDDDDDDEEEEEKTKNESDVDDNFLRPRRRKSSGPAKRIQLRKPGKKNKTKQQAVVEELTDTERVQQAFASATGGPHWRVCLVCARGDDSSNAGKTGRKKSSKKSDYAEFDDNSDLLDNRERGVLLPCDRCCTSIHAACLPSLNSRYPKRTADISEYTDAETGEFLCPLCKSPKSSMCDQCGRGLPLSAEPENEDGDRAATMQLTSKTLLRCDRCHILQHWDCAVQRLIRNFTAQQPDSTNDGEPALTYTEAMLDILHDMHCPDCILNPYDVDKVLTWRAADNDSDHDHFDHSDANIQRREYLVKFFNMSYRSVAWVAGSWLYRLARLKLKAFHRTLQKTERHFRGGSVWPRPREDVIDPLWLRVDKILDARGDEDDDADGSQPEYLVKWMGQPYTEATWERDMSQQNDKDFRRALGVRRRRRYIDSYRDLQKRRVRSKEEDLKSRPSAQRFEMLEAQPGWLEGGSLRSHQLEGLNWLLGNWRAGTSCVLADEMGLGKTIQVIAFLSYLFHEYKRYPFLIVAPNSTLDNWEREFNKWAPDMLAVVCPGVAKESAVVKQYEIFRPKTSAGKASLCCHAVIVGYEGVLVNPELKGIPWDCLVVDEGHRLKNDESKLFTKLQDFTIFHKVLLTGTPLQNNVRELFNLMHFLEPDSFGDPIALAREFDMEQAGTSSAQVDEKVRELHQKLRPHFLRRMKSAVLRDLPPKAEILVPVQMSALQRELIRDLYSSSNEFLKALGRVASKGRLGGGTRVLSLHNLLMQCRKVLSHPFLIDEVEAGLGELTDPEAIHKRLITSCGKLDLLHKMLVRLKAEGHKVLVFCQFKATLDVLEDYLHEERWRYCRLDGDIERSARQDRIDLFNTDPETFVFLLSTRAGGVGINLTAADTVIIYDVDWNPHQDLQAIGRAHRIGQQRSVLAFKFVTVGSAEEKIVAVGRKKLALDHVVVQRMKGDGDDVKVTEDDVMDVLKYGAKAVFEEDARASSSGPTYDDTEIAKLLDRSQVAALSNAEEGQSDAAAEAFGFEKVWMNRKLAGAEDDQPAAEGAQAEGEGAWDDILEKVKQNAVRLTTGELDRSKRRKAHEPGLYAEVGSAAAHLKEKARAAEKPSKQHKGKSKLSDPSQVKATVTQVLDDRSSGDEEERDGNFEPAGSGDDDDDDDTDDAIEEWHDDMDIEDVVEAAAAAEKAREKLGISSSTTATVKDTPPDAPKTKPANKRLRRSQKASQETPGWLDQVLVNFLAKHPDKPPTIANVVDFMMQGSGEPQPSSAASRGGTGWHYSDLMERLGGWDQIVPTAHLAQRLEQIRRARNATQDGPNLGSVPASAVHPARHVDVRSRLTRTLAGVQSQSASIAVTGPALAAHFAAQEPCWICYNSLHETSTFHVPTRCPALVDLPYCLLRLQELRSQQPLRRGFITFLTILLRRRQHNNPDILPPALAHPPPPPPPPSAAACVHCGKHEGNHANCPHAADLNQLLQARAKLLSVPDPTLTVPALIDQLIDIEDNIARLVGWSRDDVAKTRLRGLKTVSEQAKTALQLV
ncbi:hypothetical protein RI367_003399 [Sorochytrium milnesiophthora]